MKKLTLGIALGLTTLSFAQTNPAITSWLQNTTQTGSYYTSGNSTPISNGIAVNCQAVQYSSNWAYVTTNGIPAYPTGPFLDGNPSQATDQNAIFKFPLNPTQNTVRQKDKEIERLKHMNNFSNISLRQKDQLIEDQRKNIIDLKD